MKSFIGQECVHIANGDAKIILYAVNSVHSDINMGNSYTYSPQYASNKPILASYISEKNREVMI